MGLNDDGFDDTGVVRRAGLARDVARINAALEPKQPLEWEVAKQREQELLTLIDRLAEGFLVYAAHDQSCEVREEGCACGYNETERELQDLLQETL